MEPASSWMLVKLVNTAPAWELHHLLLYSNLPSLPVYATQYTLEKEGKILDFNPSLPTGRVVTLLPPRQFQKNSTVSCPKHVIFPGQLLDGMCTFYSRKQSPCWVVPPYASHPRSALHTLLKANTGDKWAPGSLDAPDALETPWNYTQNHSCLCAHAFVLCVIGQMCRFF